jgi:hypothetical protein
MQRRPKTYSLAACLAVGRCQPGPYGRGYTAPARARTRRATVSDGPDSLLFLAPAQPGYAEK